jgi:hypothetical protein
MWPGAKVADVATGQQLSVADAVGMERTGNSMSVQYDNLRVSINM